MKNLGKTRIKSYLESFGYFNSDKGYVFTPANLSEEMIEKIPECKFKSSSDKFLNVDCTSSWTLLVVIIKRLKKYNHSDENIKNRVFGFCPTPHQVDLIKSITGLTHIYCCNYLTKSTWPDICKNMKFETIVGNPPYQNKKEENKKSSPIWHLFVQSSFDHLVENGHLCLVHPSSWRNVDGSFEEVKNALMSKQIQYLEMHDKLDGMKTFGATTTYDWYVVKNCKNGNNETIIKSKNEPEFKINLGKYKFIPSGKFDLFDKLLAKENEPTVEILYDRSLYGTDKNNISKTKTKTFVHPCVYIVKVDDSLKLVYSDVKKGHFGIPKLIWGNGGCEMGSFLDTRGEYGMTQWSYGIVDNVENLKDIKKAFDTKEFRDLMRYCTDGGGNINYKVISLFRKDFYKDFL